MPVVGEYKRGERGREAPKSLLEEKMIEASGERVCVLRVAWKMDDECMGEPASSFYRHKEGRDTCMGKSQKSSSSPRIGEGGLQ